jgi:hypothetical protein
MSGVAGATVLNSSFRLLWNQPWVRGHLASYPASTVSTPISLHDSSAEVSPRPALSWPGSAVAGRVG